MIETLQPCERDEPQRACVEARRHVCGTRLAFTLPINLTRRTAPVSEATNKQMDAYCEIFNKLYDNIVNSAGRRCEGLVPAETPQAAASVIEGQWYCPHGLIAMLPGPNNTSIPFHNVDPALIGHIYETTTVADGA